MHTKSILGFLSILLVASPLRALEPWEDDLRNYRGDVVLSAPSGYTIHATPVAGSPAKGTIPGPTQVAVSGFVEAGGTKFYMTSASRSAWIENQTAPVWISAGGNEQLPPLPRLLKRGEGEHPDSGEMVMIEAYEETIAIEPESRWPIAETKAEKFFPAALLAVGEDASGNTTAEFQLFMNGNALTAGYPFAEPSYRQLTSGEPNPMIRLYSRPGVVNMRLIIAVPQSTVFPVLQPGLIFQAGFAKGKLVRLSLGGDAWSEAAVISRLGAPVFRRDEKIVFGFNATEVLGEGTPIRVLPDRIAGADYTLYREISQMGAPFDEYHPAEFQGNWTLHIEGDLTMTLLAPLYDGRGAPGMLELEGLSLDAAPPAPNPDNLTDEQYAAMRDKLPKKTDASLFGEGWKSILETKLGEIPASQRVEEQEPAGF